MHSAVGRSLICAALLTSCVALRAEPVTWKVAAYAPGATPVPGIGGTFTYDAATGQMLSWDIHFGMDTDVGYISFGPATPACEQIMRCGVAGTYSNDGDYFYTFTGNGQAVTLALPNPLTDAGGTVALLPGSPSDDSGSLLIYSELPLPNKIVAITSGSVSSIPEPTFGFCVAILVLGAIFAPYLKSRRA